MVALPRSDSTASGYLWTVEEVAGYLCLQPETVRAKTRKGGLPACKIGKRIWRFDIAEINSFLKLSKG